MAFSLQCNNKGCFQTQQPYLDPKTECVYCSACDKEIQQVTSFVKNQMKMFKQFKEKKKLSFSTKCGNCSTEDRPVKKEKLWACRGCGKELHLSPTFLSILESHLGAADKEL